LVVLYFIVSPLLILSSASSSAKSLPERALRAVAFSTIHKAFLLDLLPDEEGVMALSGVTSAGNRIWVTFIQESSDALQFTGFWRAPGQPVDAPGLPRMSAQLRRLRPLQFANPPG
jgi:hypothetical protein